MDIPITRPPSVAAFLLGCHGFRLVQTPDLVSFPIRLDARAASVHPQGLECSGIALSHVHRGFTDEVNAGLGAVKRPCCHHCGKGFCVSFAFRQSLIHNHNSIDGLTAADPLLRCWRCLRKDNVDRCGEKERSQTCHQGDLIRRN